MRFSLVRVITDAAVVPVQKPAGLSFNCRLVDKSGLLLLTEAGARVQAIQQQIETK